MDPVVPHLFLGGWELGADLVRRNKQQQEAQAGGGEGKCFCATGGSGGCWPPPRFLCEVWDARKGNGGLGWGP